MKRTGASCIMLLVVLGAFPARAAHVSTAETLHYNLVDFTVKARREAPNDLMTAVLFAEAVGASPADLAARVNERIAAATAETKKIPAVKIESGDYRTWANYQKDRQEGWRTRAELRLESRDVAALAKLVGRLQAADMQLAGMDFSLSPDLRSKIEEELTKEALAAFQSRADLIRQSLKAASLKIVTVHITTQAPQPQRPMLRARAVSAAMAGAPQPPAEAGTSDITVIATGTVQLQ